MIGVQGISPSFAYLKPRSETNRVNGLHYQPSPMTHALRPIRAQKKSISHSRRFQRARFREEIRNRPECFLKNCYAIIKTSSFYGAETKISLVVDDTGSQYLSFSRPEEARAWIRQLTGRKHYLRQNESSPATYAVTEVGSANFCDAKRRKT
jgi:hypothetical protein